MFFVTLLRAVGSVILALPAAYKSQQAQKVPQVLAVVDVALPAMSAGQCESQFHSTDTAAVPKNGVVSVSYISNTGNTDGLRGVAAYDSGTILWAFCADTDQPEQTLHVSILTAGKDVTL